MGRNFSASLVAASMILSGCASTSQESATPYQRVLIAGYECEFTKPLSKGAFQSRFKLLENGEVKEGYGLRWEYRPPYAPPEVRIPGGSFRSGDPTYFAAWYRDKNGAFSEDLGNIYLSSTIFHIDPKVNRKGFKLKTTLRVAPDAPQYGRNAIETPLTGDHNRSTLSINWPEFAALVRGSAQLYLVSTDEDRKVAARTALDHTLLQEVERTLPEAFAEIDDMRANYREKCTFTEDIEGDPVIVV